MLLCSLLDFFQFVYVTSYLEFTLILLCVCFGCWSFLFGDRLKLVLVVLDFRHRPDENHHPLGLRLTQQNVDYPSTRVSFALGLVKFKYNCTHLFQGHQKLQITLQNNEYQSSAKKGLYYQRNQSHFTPQLISGFQVKLSMLLWIWKTWIRLKKP